MAKWLSIVFSMLLLSLALDARADTYKVKATSAQQAQMMTLLTSVFGTKPLPKADFEKRVAELWGMSITFPLAAEQTTAMKRAVKVTRTSATLSMNGVLNADKWWGICVVKDGLYQIPPLSALVWKSYLDEMPAIDIDYTPAPK